MVALSRERSIITGLLLNEGYVGRVVSIPHLQGVFRRLCKQRLKWNRCGMAINKRHIRFAPMPGPGPFGAAHKLLPLRHARQCWPALPDDAVSTFDSTPEHHEQAWPRHAVLRDGIKNRTVFR